MDDSKIDLIHKKVEEALNDLRLNFIDEAELTFIMRVPGKPNAYIIISNDNLVELSRLLSDHIKSDIKT